MTRYLFALVATLTPAIAWAQDEPAGAGWDVFATIYVSGFVALAAVAAWAVSKLASYMKAKEAVARAEGKTILWHGFVSRAVARVQLGATDIGREWKRLMEAAQDPASPGGKQITQAELDAARARLLEYVKAGYGNWDAIVREFGEILSGNDGAEDVIKAKIATAIDEQAAAANPPGPGPG